MKVLVAIDDSPYSTQVVETIINRSWPAHTEFKVLSVLEALCDCLDDDVVSLFSDTLSTLNDRRKRAARKQNERVCHKIESHVTGVKAHSEVREGLPRVEIVNAAVDWNADLILIGAHGADVCPRNLMGSVSRGVVNHAPCTVEVVRMKTMHKNQPDKKVTETGAGKKR